MKPEELTNLIEEYIEEEKILSERRVAASTDKNQYRDALQRLWNQDIQHLSTISATDLGDKTELIYHISADGTILDLSLEIPNDNLEIKTITDIYPGALLYERELMDLFGIEILEHPDPRKLILPDDWPDYKHPLRKGQYDYQKVSELSISEIKDIAEDEAFNYEMMLEVERENKDRKTLKEWLEKQIEETEEEE